MQHYIVRYLLLHYGSTDNFPSFIQTAIFSYQDHLLMPQHSHTHLTILCISDARCSVLLDSSHSEERGCFCPVSGLLATGSKVDEKLLQSPSDSAII